MERASLVYYSLSLGRSHFLLGVPVGIRLPKRAGRFRNFAGGIPRAMKQLFKEVSISAPKRDTRCLMLRLTNGNILKASVLFDPRERNGSFFSSALTLVVTIYVKYHHSPRDGTNDFFLIIRLLSFHSFKISLRR